MITRKLRLYTTTTHTIYPSYGSASFFEFTFRNPYPQEQCFFIEFDDPELNLLTNTDEWRHFKKMNNLITPMEEDMFDGNKLWMHPNEVLTIPFKFQVRPPAPSLPSQFLFFVFLFLCRVFRVDMWEHLMREVLLPSFPNHLLMNPSALGPSQLYL